MAESAPPRGVPRRDAYQQWRQRLSDKKAAARELAYGSMPDEPPEPELILRPVFIPDEPEEPVERPAPVVRDEPAKPAQGAEPVKPVSSVKPVKPVKPVKVVKAADPEPGADSRPVGRDARVPHPSVGSDEDIDLRELMRPGPELPRGRAQVPAVNRVVDTRRPKRTGPGATAPRPARSRDLAGHDEDTRVRALRSSVGHASDPEPRSTNRSMADELRDLNLQRVQGIISEDEFKARQAALFER